jgi:hypothetical protein
MLSHTPRKPHSTPTQEPDDADPTHLPVDPDEGPVPAAIPPDPESERVVDPESGSAKAMMMAVSKRYLSSRLTAMAM